MSSPARVIRAIEDRNSRGIPVALAVHPWEIDPDPPRVTLPPAKSFAHYFRLGGFRRRLETHPARRVVRADGRRARAVPGRTMTVRVALALAALVAPGAGARSRRGREASRHRDRPAAGRRAAAGRPAPHGADDRQAVDRRDGPRRPDGGRDARHVCRIVLGVYQSRNMQVVLALGRVPATDDDVEPGASSCRPSPSAAAGRSPAIRSDEIQAGAAPDVNRYVYLLKLAAVQIRSVDSDALVLQGGIPASDVDWQGRVFAAGAGPYVDGIAHRRPGRRRGRAVSTGRRADGGARRDVRSRRRPCCSGRSVCPRDPAAATSRSMDAVIRWLGTSIQVTAFAGDAAAVRATLAAAARLTDLITGDLVTLDERTADLRILQGASNVTSTVTHRLVYSLTGFETFLVYWGTRRTARRSISRSPLPNVTTPMVRDPRTGASEAPARVQKGPQDNRLRMALPAADHPLIVDFNFGNSSSLGSIVDVRKDALPRVEEIIFRHQQAQAAQDVLLRNYIAHVRIEQHFHPSPADPAYNLVTENRLFSEHGAVEWEELSFELNGAKWTTNRPAFPLVQPEKVLSLPLDLRLNQDYAYRLDGVDTVGERPAFVVRFDPLDAVHALYRGTVWIDRATYVRLKVQAVETKLSGPVVSNDETQIFEPAGNIAGRPVWLLSHLISKQTFLIAGRNVLIEREVHLSDFVLNAPDFDRERTAARASDRIMYRDTDEGVRYLVKQGETRVVSDQMTTLGARVRPGGRYRSVVRHPASDRRPQYPRLQLPEPESPAGAALWRRDRVRQHPARESVGRQVRRQRRLLRPGAQGERRSVRCERETERRARQPDSRRGRPQSGLPGHAVSEGQRVTTSSNTTRTSAMPRRRRAS